MLKKSKQRFGWRIIMTFVLINLFFVIFLSIFVFGLLRSILYRNNYLIVSDLTNQVASYCDRQLDNTEKAAQQYLFDFKFIYSLQTEYEAYDAYTILNDYIIPKGNATLTTLGMGSSCKLYVYNDTIPERYYNSASEVNTFGAFEVMHIRRLDSQIAQALWAGDEFMAWTQSSEDKRKSTVSLYVTLLDLVSMRKVGVAVFTIRESSLFLNHVDNNALSSDVMFEITGGDNVAVKNTVFTIANEGDYITVKKSVLKGEFSVCAYLDKKLMNAGMGLAAMQTVMLSLVGVALTLAFGIFLKKTLYTEMNVILQGIKEFKKGNNSYRIETKRDDEFAQIAHQLNSYASSVEQLVEDVYEAMIQKQDMELHMLQAKINPHFLYNIFSIIVELSKAAGNETLVNVADSTVKFYRKLLSKDTRMNTLKDELDMTRAYSEIISIKNADNIHFVFDTQDSALDCLVPNFIVQPIAENCVKHAVVDGRIRITITTCRVENDLIITVNDDGIGMTEEQTRECLNHRPNGGYGLYNIIARLNLRYGNPRYTLKLESEYQKGTTIKIVLPFVTGYDDNDFGEVEFDV